MELKNALIKKGKITEEEYPVTYILMTLLKSIKTLVRDVIGYKDLN